jgi:nitroreductase
MALEAIARRRSTRIFRWYREVEPDRLAIVLEAARRASHWGNLGAVGAIVVRRHEAPEDVKEVLHSEVGAIALQTASVVLVWYTDVTRGEELEQRQLELVQHRAFGVDETVALRRIKRLVLPLLTRRWSEVLRSGIFELDAGQAIAQATLAATSLGLGSCLVGLRDTPQLRKRLQVPDHVKLLVFQALGYPLESTDVPPRPKRNFEETFSESRYGQGFKLEQSVRMKLDELFGVECEPAEWRDRELKELSRMLGELGRMV